MVSGYGDEDLSLSPQTSEGVGVDDAVSISLIRGSNRRLGLRTLSTSAAVAVSSMRRKDFILQRLQAVAVVHN
jgi:hypothetical protein